MAQPQRRTERWGFDQAGRRQQLHPEFLFVNNRVEDFGDFGVGRPDCYGVLPWLVPYWRV